jgi:hypothetical protein
MKQYKKYVAQQQKYIDDQQDLAEDLEIYLDFDEGDSRYIDKFDANESYTGRRSMPVVTSNSDELTTWT